MKKYAAQHMRGAIAAALLVATASPAWSATFGAPQQLTPGDQKYQFPRNPSGAIAFDASGRLHITYWAGTFLTSPDDPSFIYYQNFTTADDWSAREEVANSTIDLGSGPQPYGGRHPSLVVLPTGDALIAWHDHRHCDPDPPGNNSDNTEIYLNRRAAVGTFPAVDERITNTNAGGLGDNGYLPRIVAADNGRLAIVWYDFHFDGNISDIFVRFSDTSGVFPAETMSDWQRTDGSTRVDFNDAYSVPDAAFDSTGLLHMIWTTGFSATAPTFYATVDPTAGPGLVTETVIANDSAAFFDPPKIVVDGDDTVWLVYGSDVSGEQDIRVRRKLSTDVSFGAPVTIKGTVGVVEKSPALAVDSDGKLHVTWINDGATREVRYGRFDYDTTTLETEVTVTTSNANWDRPTIALDGDGEPWVAWEANVNFTDQGDIWLAQPSTMTSVSGWELY